MADDAPISAEEQGGHLRDLVRVRVRARVRVRVRARGICATW